jgi:hypothetical protein
MGRPTNVGLWYEGSRCKVWEQRDILRWPVKRRLPSANDEHRYTRTLPVHLMTNRFARSRPRPQRHYQPMFNAEIAAVHTSSSAP